MKPFHKFFNTDKAALLFELFPDELPGIIEYLHSHCRYVIENKESLQQKWEEGFFTLDAWVKLAGEVQEIISKYGKRLHQQKRLFTDQFFDMPVVFFVIDAIVKYGAANKDKRKLAAMIDILFNP